MLEKIRDLKVKIPSRDTTIDAAYIRDTDSGIIYYKEEGRELTAYPGHKYCCADCIHCDHNPKTENVIYQVKPLPAHICKCDIIDKKYKDFDITFKADTSTCKHPVCKRFKPRFNYDAWNLNQYIDNQNSCIHRDKAFIQSLSYKGNQVPFTFYVDKDKWENLNFIKEIDGHLCMKVYNPIFWDDFRIRYERNGITYIEKHSGADEYAAIHNITDIYIRYEIRRAFHSNWIESNKLFSGRIFDLDTMWFRR